MTAVRIVGGVATYEACLVVVACVKLAWLILHHGMPHVGGIVDGHFGYETIAQEERDKGVAAIDIDAHTVAFATRLVPLMFFVHPTPITDAGTLSSLARRFHVDG